MDGWFVVFEFVYVYYIVVNEGVVVDEFNGSCWIEGFFWVVVNCFGCVEDDEGFNVFFICKRVVFSSFIKFKRFFFGNKFENDFINVFCFFFNFCK